MSTEVKEAVFKFTADTSGLKTGAQQAKKALDDVSDAASGAQKQSGGAFSGLDKEISSSLLKNLELMVKQLGSMGRSLATLTSFSQQNSKALAGLSEKIGNVGTRAVRANNGLKGSGTAAKGATKEIAGLEKELNAAKEQYDQFKAIGFSDSDPNVKMAAGKVQELEAQLKKLKGADPLREFGDEAAVTNQEIADLMSELRELEAEQKQFKSIGKTWGYDAFENNAARIREINAEVKEYQKQMSQPVTVNISVSDNLTAQWKQAKANLASLERAGFGLKDANYNAQYQEVVRLSEAVKAYQKNLADTATAQVQQTDNLHAAVASYADDLKRLRAVGLGAGDAQYDAKYQGWVKANAALKEYEKNLAAAALQESEAVDSSGVERLSAAFSELGSKVAHVGGAVASAVGPFALKATGLSGIAEKLRSIGSGARTSTSGVEGLVRSIRNIGIVSVGLRLCSGLFGQLRSVVSSYVSSNEALSSSVERLKNGLGQALAPAINVVINAMSRLLPYIVGIADAIASLITNIFGKGWTSVSTGASSAAGAVDGVTDATEGATAAQEEYNRTIAGFDEITKLEDNSSSGGTGGSGSPSGATTSTTDGGEGIVGILPEWLKNLAGQISNLLDKEDFTGIGALLATKFGELVDFADQKLTAPEFQAKVFNMCSHVTDVINGFFGELTYSDGTRDSIATRTGDLIGDAISLALNTIDRFLTRVKWSNIGRAVAQGINGAIASLNENDVKFGTVLADILNAGIRGLNGFVSDLHWSEIGEFIAGNVNSFFTTTEWKTAGETATNLITGLCEMLTTAINGIDKGAIEQAFIDFFGSLDYFKIINSVVGLLQSAMTLDPILSTMIPPEIDTSVSVELDDHPWQTFLTNFKQNQYVQAFVQLVQNGWKTVGDWVKDRIGGVVEFAVSVKNDAATWWSNVKKWWNQKVGQVTNFTTNVTNSATTWWNNVKSWWGGKVGSVSNFKTNVTNNATTWWSNVKTWWAGKAKATLNVAVSITNQASTWWSNVKKWWSQKVGSLTAKFNLQLPKVSVTWSGSPIALPKFSVKWNAQGGILDEATLFGMAGNTLLGGGEAGREAVLPLDRNTGWMDTFAEKVAQRVSNSGSNNNQPIIIHNYVQLDGKTVGKSVVAYINGVAKSTGVNPLSAYI